jgi:hypothetical protein
MLGSASIADYKSGDLYRNFYSSYDRRFYATEKRHATLDQWVVACKIIQQSRAGLKDDERVLRPPEGSGGI